MADHFNKFFIILSIFLMISCGGEGSGSLTGERIYVDITLANIPNQVSYNKLTTSSNVVEYEWGVTFDVNSDGVISDGDLSLQLSHFKPPEASPATGSIENFSADLYVQLVPGARGSVSEATVLVSGNTISLSIDRSAHESLEAVNASTLVYFYTSLINTPGPALSDYYPFENVMGSIPLSGILTDDVGESTETGYSLADLVSMEIYF